MKDYSAPGAGMVADHEPEPDNRRMGAYDYLHQGDVWRDGAGQHIPVSGIDARYAGNILRFMERQAPRWVVIYWLDFWNQCSGMPMGDMAEMVVDREEAYAMDHPVEWVRETELYKAIAEQATS